jgi:hypothetical protein
MKTTISAFAFLLLAAASCLPAQVDPAPAAGTKVDKDKVDKEIAEKVARLKEVVNDRKVAHDDEGRQIIDALVQKLQAGVGDKDRQAIVKSLDGVFNQGKLREPEKAQLYMAAAAALGQCGADGAKVLQAAIDGKRFPDKPQWVPLRETMLKFLGKTKDESMVKFLVEVARRSHEAGLQAAAGEALGNFEESKDAIRKNIVSDVLVTYGEIDKLSRDMGPGNVDAQNAKDRLAAISDKWNTMLGRLTRQNFRSYPEWQQWYNKHKSVEWK